MSKRYTAVTLGEIMAQRAFTSLEGINAARKKDNVTGYRQPAQPGQRGARRLGRLGYRDDTGRRRISQAGLDIDPNQNREERTQLLRLVRIHCLQEPGSATAGETLWESYAYAWDIAIRVRNKEFFFPTITDELISDTSKVKEIFLTQSPAKRKRTTEWVERAMEEETAKAAANRPRLQPVADMGTATYNTHHVAPAPRAMAQPMGTTHNPSRRPSLFSLLQSSPTLPLPTKAKVRARRRKGQEQQ